jgi:two-component system sensor histidine kinase RstB
MFKAFTALWLLVFFPIIFLIVPSDYNPLPRINEYAQESYFITTFKGTFSLIETRLVTIKPVHWKQEIEDISTHFGFKLQLLPLQGASNKANKQQDLLSNEFILNIGEVSSLLRRVGDSQWVISLDLDESSEENFRRHSAGPLYLLSLHLQQLPEPQWQSSLKKLAENYPFELAILDKNKLVLTERQIEQLNNNQQLVISLTNQLTSFYYPLSESKVLRAGEVNTHGDEVFFYFLLVFTFVALISLAMLFWVYPLWRDLNLLADTAGNFGDGYLKQRAKVSKYSLITRLGSSFNTMAASVEKLILGHRELTNAIAHDLRTPLYRLRFAFEILDDDDLNAQQKQKYKSSINSSIDDLDHLINQTLMLSRYSRMMDISQFSHCLLGDKISNEIDHYRLQQKQLVMMVDIDDSLKNRNLLVDSRALIRALNNLLTNAGRYAKTKIKVSLHEREQHCFLSIEDDGQGIAEAQWGKIFEPFAQLDNAQRNAGNGHGLGLAIVKQIAMWHKGDVTISHSPLGGAKFEIRWPLQLG